ncbi:MAG: FtsX-like permease family protein [Firmicutes bacterium]|nr:FtsX-like permease family protein [Bacillota bacterium]MBR6585639.1 FtsX-like permease family protein [Bacillota bacterium]
MITQIVALKNLQRRPVRTWCMVFFVFMLAASLFMSSVLVDSMEESLEKTVNRIGADVIVVPKEYESNMADSLFMGELCNFSFDSKWVEDIKNVDGIEAISPQLYMQTMSASCCDSAVQLIAFDPETDFIVSSWLEDDGIKMPGRGEFIVGSSITPGDSGTMKFFNVEYKVIGQLEKTGTSYDSCVFMNYDTAQDMMNGETWVKFFGETPDVRRMVSSLMIRAEEDMPITTIAGAINFKLPDGSPVSAYTTNGIMSDAMASIESMGSYTRILMGLISVLVVAALLCIFTITINERTKEFGILASLGADSRKLSGIVLTEGFMIGLAGGLIGTAVSVAVIMIFGGTIVNVMELPQLNSDIAYMLMLGLKCTGLALVVSVAASLYSAWKVSRNNLDALIKGEEM